MLELVNKRNKTPFEEQDLNILFNLADQAAISIDHVRLRDAHKTTGQRSNERSRPLPITIPLTIQRPRSWSLDTLTAGSIRAKSSPSPSRRTCSD